jgi:alpha-L-rhamnosidase
MSKMAIALDKDSDATLYASLLPKIKKAFNKKYYNKTTGKYGNGGQTSQALALYFNLVSAKEKQKVLAVLLDDIKSRENHFDVGVVGLKFLFNVLCQEGHSGLLYKMVTQKNLPGFAYWLEQGANTLWQDWDGSMSLNHIMFGTVSEWFFESLAGIRLDEASPGMEHFYIKPDLIETINWVSADHSNRYGKIVSAWQRDAGNYTFNIEVPSSSTASFYLPIKGQTIIYNEAQMEIENNENVYTKEDKAFLKLSSGKHKIEFMSE